MIRDQIGLILANIAMPAADQAITVQQPFADMSRSWRIIS